MPTKPGANYTPRPRADAPSTGSARDAFLDVDKIHADEFTKMTFRLPKSLHKEIKVAAIARDITVQDYVCAVLVEKLDDRQ